jgi:hypothetical protein
MMGKSKQMSKIKTALAEHTPLFYDKRTGSFFSLKNQLFISRKPSFGSKLRFYQGYLKLYVALPSFTCAGINSSFRSNKMGLPSILVRVFGLTVMAD